MFAACADSTTGFRSDVEHLRGQHRLNRHVGITVFCRSAILGRQGTIRRFIERLARTNRVNADLRIRILQLLANESDVERPETLERPQGVKTGELILSPRVAASF